jgi:hypothetical protein
MHRRHRGCDHLSTGRQVIHYYSLAKSQCVSYQTSPVKGAIVEDFYFVFPTQAQEDGNVIEGHELAVEI